MQIFKEAKTKLKRNKSHKYDTQQLIFKNEPDY